MLIRFVFRMEMSQKYQSRPRQPLRPVSKSNTMLLVRSARSRDVSQLNGSNCEERNNIGLDRSSTSTESGAHQTPQVFREQGSSIQICKSL